MKVLFFTGEYTEGGAERVMSILANSFVNRGIDVELLSYYDSELFYSLDERIVKSSVCHNTGSKNTINNLLYLRRYFKENGDIIVSFLAPFNILSIIASLFIHKPIIVADRNDPSRIPGNKLIRKLRDFLYRFADGVVVQTFQNSRYFDYLDTKVIANPIDFDQYLGEALNTEKKNKIVNVGRLKSQKNQKMLIEALKSVDDKYYLEIYGEGELKDELVDFADKCGVKDRVFLMGNCRDVFERIKDAQVFVLSSDYEGMPNALIEAMCLGLPVISTRVSGTEELITDNENGMLVDINDVNGLSKKLNLLLNDDELRYSVAHNAVKVYEKLRSDKITDEWFEFVTEVKNKYNS